MYMCVSGRKIKNVILIFHICVLVFVVLRSINCTFTLAKYFSFLCCPIMCLYVLSSMSSHQLRFRIKMIFGSSLPPVVCRRTHVLFTLFVFVWVYVGVQYRMCCVFVLFFLVLCTLCRLFLWNVHF